ncbi:B3 domain-containing protein-like [Iris pallida]|uniref:B3 domain-containing protein-like n=1 Tax=Iris pallida TaxID=29817 RepID=A0AAX6DGV9_IRIPA|nr:B3 domain-containing protein-like [Iris pallida]
MKEELKEFAEQYYWNHMSRFHFIAIMPRGFDREMVLPEKFVKCFKDKLSENVILRGPSGNLWRVKLLKVQDDLLLKDGWKEFAEAHNVEEGDMLSFEYEGYSCFNVLVYDKKDHCERETSYFARNHKNVLAGGDCVQDKPNMGDSAENMLHSPTVHCDDNAHVEQPSLPGFPALNGKTACSSLGVKCADRRRKVRITDLSVHKTYSAENMLPPDNLHSDYNPQVKLPAPPKFPASNGKTASTSAGVELAGVANRRRKVRKSELADHLMGSAENMNKHLNLNMLEDACTSEIKVGHARKLVVRYAQPEPVQLSTCERSTSEVQLKSNRRPVTNEDKDRALQLASEIKPANPSFRIVLRDSHVYKTFFMTVPADFVAAHHLLKWTSADLRIPDGKETWCNVHLQAKVRSAYTKAQCGFAGTQWRKFVQDNNLEEGDVCIFELCSSETDLIFDVHIFRVVNELAPLTKESVVG